MKTLAELEAMTKEEIDVYAKEAFGADLDRRFGKDTLIEQTLALQAEAEVAEPDPEPQAPPAGPIAVRITVTDYPVSSGVPLSINGRRWRLPIGKPVTVPAWVIPTLRAVAGLKFTQE